MTTIGVFDSGIGGLTVAKQINLLLPSAKIIYFGDIAHLPYGDKSKEAIVSYAKKIGEFLIDQNCQHIVIACNTASAFAFESLKRHLYGKAFVYNVIDPVVEYVLNNYSNDKIGVIGTKGTISSRIYPRKINKKSSVLKVTSLATPLLAPMIEEGFFNNNISKTIINAYLSKKELTSIKAIILACTHYPLIEDAISEYYGKSVDVLNTAEIVAKYFLNKIGNSVVVASSQPKHQFYVSDYTDSFKETSQLFFGEQIKLTKKNIWD